jgi:hypothetical protein
MQLTMEQAFKTDLAMLISKYITKGLEPDIIEEELLDAAKDLFYLLVTKAGEQRQWYDTSAELS